MNKATFVYVIYIATTAETVWQALLDGEFTRQYWNADNISDWQPGSNWEHRLIDAKRSPAIVGQVLEVVAPRHLAVTWANPAKKANPASCSRVSYDIDDVDDMVRLTVTHSELESDMYTDISRGWPRVLSSLKSLLETGRPLNTWVGRQVPLAQQRRQP